MSKDSRVQNWTGPYALFTTPALMFITNQIDGPSYLKRIFASKERFSIMEIIPLMFLYGYDDFGTARGFQNKERTSYEENPVYSGFVIWAMERGYAKTETAAMRLLGFYNQLLILLGNQFFGFNSISQVSLYLIGILKTSAGRPWSFYENDFTWKDLFTFKDGEPTPWVWSKKDLNSF